MCANSGAFICVNDLFEEDLPVRIPPEDQIIYMAVLEKLCRDLDYVPEIYLLKGTCHGKLFFFFFLLFLK